MSASGVNRIGIDWIRIDRWLKEQLELANNEMANGLPVEEYHRVVGKVQLIRNLRDWVEPTTTPEIAEDDYGISAELDGKY